MTTQPAPVLPASSLLDLATRKVAPFDKPYWLTSVDGTSVTPPMLVEGVNEFTFPDSDSPDILLSVWPELRRTHVMHGLVVDADAILTFTFDSPR
jgi:hypothetical protein